MTVGRIKLTRLKKLAAAKQDFAFESTLSSRSFAPFLRRLRAQGYQVAIYYFFWPVHLWLCDASSSASQWVGMMYPQTPCAAATHAV